MSDESRLTREILVFLGLTLVFSCVGYGVIGHAGDMRVGGGSAVTLLMWSPAFAAFATCALFRIDIASLGWGWGPWRYQWAAYLLPFAYALPVYVLTWLLVPGSAAYGTFAKQEGASWGLPNAPDLAVWLLALPAHATVGLARSLSSAFGEEIGWRGFLLPRMNRRVGYTLACLITGLIWAFWHYPGILAADYNAGANKAFEVGCFTLMVVSMSFITGWLRLKSGSLWAAAVLHASHNLFIQRVFDEMTAPVGPARWITTEFGAGMALTSAAVAICCWTRRGELKPAEAPA